MYGFPQNINKGSFINSFADNKNQSLNGFDNQSPIPYGILIEDTYQRASLGNDYTKTGSVSASIVGNELVVSGGVRSSTFAEYIRHTGYGFTGLDSWTQTIEYVSGTKAASGADTLGIGVKGSQSNGLFTVYAGLLSAVSAAADGQLNVYFQSGSGAPSVLVSSGVTLLTHSIGHKIKLVLDYANHILTATAINMNTGLLIKVSYNPGMAVLTNGAGGTAFQSMGYFTLLTFGGTQNVSLWKIESNEYKNADYAFLGDSITEGFCVSTINDSYASKFASAKPSFKTVRFAKANATSSDGVNMLPEIIRFKPKTVFIMLGGNDINFSVATATWQANLRTIWNTLKNNNINFVLLFATPRSNGTGTFNIVPVNTFYANSGYRYIPNTYADLAIGITANARFLAADLIHPNSLGHKIISEIILNEL